MPMSVGQVKVHAENPVDEDVLDTGRTAIPVAIARNLPEQDMGILLFQHFPIVIVISQMDHAIGLDLVHAQPHKPERTVRIRQHQ
jgi:hypothetical protein